MTRFWKLKLGAAIALTALFAHTGHAADVKISALPDGTTLQATDQIPVNRAGTTNRTVVNGTALANILTCSADQIVFDSAGVLVCNAGLTFTTAAGIQIALAEPRIRLSETDQGTDLKNWDIDESGGKVCIRTRTDADGAGVSAICFTRGTTTNVSIVDIGNATSNPAYNFLGTGTVTLTGGITGSSGGTWTAGRMVVNSATIATNGLYLPAANTVGLAANSTQVATGTPTQFTTAAGLQSGGTKFTASGCSNSTTVGGAIAGEFTSGTTGTCTVTITLPAATNKWHCNAADRTTPANPIVENAATTTSSTITGTTVTGDILGFSCMAY